MWHKRLAILALLSPYNAFAAPTWPSSVDEIEDLMMLQSGYRAPEFGSAVSPCSASEIQGFRTAAGFLRTAFHDVAAFDAKAGTGGLDASIGFEQDGDFKVHNAGPAFPGAMAYFTSFFNSKASMSDLIALGTYAAVRSCGGPIIPMRAGRIDATGAGPNELPDTADDASTLVGRFAKMGFSPQEMIQLVACGHSLGGVHPGVNPALNSQDPGAVNDAASKGVLAFDTTDAAYDNRIATEYIDGTTKNPLVVGPAQFNSDLRIFSIDNNATIRAMTNPTVYAGVCQSMLQRMLEKVPRSVTLSDTISPYDVKPGQLNLNVLADDSLVFSGEIRIRTTNLAKASIAKVTLVYSDKSGKTCQGCSIEASVAGDAQGFDDSFTFYGFSGKVDSISSFNVVITTDAGQQRVYTNNGNGYKINDGAFVQASSSSYSGSQLSVVVAVRSEQAAQPVVTLSQRSGYSFNTLPTISKSTGSVSKFCGGTKWTYYTATFTLDSGSADSAKLEVSVGGTVVDAFRSIKFPSSGNAPVCIDKVTTTTASTTTVSTTSSSLTTTAKTSSSTSEKSSTVSSTTLSTSKVSSTSDKSSTLSSTTSSSKSDTSSSVSSSSVSVTSTKSESSSSVSSTLTSSHSGSSSSVSGTSSSSKSDSSTSASTSSVSSSSETSSHSGSATTSSNTSGTSTVSATSDKSTTTEKPAGTSKTTDKSSDPSKTTKTASASSGESGWVAWSSTTKTSSKKVSASKTTTTSSYSAPAWTAWGNAPSAVSKPKKEEAQAALASIYKEFCTKAAPSGGSDGGNKNVQGLDLSISVTKGIKPTITATTAVYTNTVVYVTTLANAQQSQDVYGNGGAPQQASGVWSTWAAQASKTGGTAKYTGAANSLRGEGVAVGVVAAVGIAAILL